ncbi:MAG TPA: hypothetical protein VGQ38_02750 [Gaiellaceae bacterium]|nr:hypothetical protein [Gaiellaceae bacterium]
MAFVGRGRRASVVASLFGDRSSATPRTDDVDAVAHSELGSHRGNRVGRDRAKLERLARDGPDRVPLIGID